MLDATRPCAVFLDIDRTLTVADFRVPERNLTAIAAARLRGHKVFINTGRSWANIPDVLKEQLDIDGYIAGNGAYLRLGEQELKRFAFPADTLYSIADYVLRHREIWIVFEGLYRNYAISNSVRGPDPSQIQIDRPEFLLQVSETDEIQSIALGPDISAPLTELLRDKCTVLPMGYYADCAVPGRSKAIGMTEMLDAVGVKRENSVAGGDSGNDLEMLLQAGVGVAVANATPEVKSKADAVVSSNADCGVAQAIEKLLLK